MKHLKTQGPKWKCIVCLLDKTRSNIYGFEKCLIENFKIECLIHIKPYHHSKTCHWVEIKWTRIYTNMQWSFTSKFCSCSSCSWDVLKIFRIFLEKFGQHLPFMNLILEEIFARKGKKTTLSTCWFPKDDGGWWSQEGEEKGDEQVISSSIKRALNL